MTGSRAILRRVRSHRMTRGVERGFTMIEVLVALAVTALMVAGVTTMITTSLEDTRGQQAALYQQQVGLAAKQLITTNASALAQATTTVVPFGGGGTYQLSTFLPPNMRSTNAYGQTPCLLVTTQSDGSLLGLLVTEGGTTIADPELGYIAANSGQGGGSIPATNNGPGSAIGAFGAWTVTAPNPSGVSCTGTKTGTGHLASEVYLGSTATQNSDYLYRVSVPGNSKANTMQVPIVLAQQQLDYTTCPTPGAIAADAAGNVVNCLKNSSGVLQWLPQASYHWRGLVADESSLGSVDPTSQSVGDVVMTVKTNRAYTYTGTGPASGWQALAVDEAGNLALGNAHTIGDTCTPDPTKTTTSVSTDKNGVVVSCQSVPQNNDYEWQPASQITLVSNSVNCMMFMQSANAVDYGTAANPCTPMPWTSLSYDGTTNTYYDDAETSITLNKPGVINVSAWEHMNDGQYGTTFTSGAEIAQYIYVYDTTGALVAQNQSQSPNLTNDSSGINNSLTYAAPIKGAYRVVVWSAFAHFAAAGTTPLPMPWTSNYLNGSNQIIANTPVAAGWTINAYY
ncbi:prepilin-type N-terminal cleavage/methylation domain-containing protein [Paraburkholderia sp.]|uniref:prepilin-type N-terminal cleavage/methylation domain-containing protein n=1 Tax=Paraburkholderia sp. TaxID=1926495 RepID=UPI003D6E840A